MKILIVGDFHEILRYLNPGYKFGMNEHLNETVIAFVIIVLSYLLTDLVQKKHILDFGISLYHIRLSLDFRVRCNRKTSSNTPGYLYARSMAIRSQLLEFLFILLSASIILKELL